MKKYLISALAAALAACSSGSLPDPKPLENFSPSALLHHAWSTKANNGDQECHLTLQPLIMNDTLYSAGNNGEISAIDIHTGKRLWHSEYEQLPFSSNIASYHGSLYIGTSQAQVAKIDQATGALLWTQSVPSTVMAAPIANDKAVFVKTINDTLTALSTTDGTPLWNTQEPMPSLVLRDASNPVLAGDQLYVGFADGVFSVFSTQTGNTIWRKQITLSDGKTDVERMIDIGATPVLDKNTLYIAVYQNFIVALDLAQQREYWRYSASVHHDITTDRDSLYLTDADDNVIALNKATGQVVWKQEALQYRSLSAPLSIDDMLVIGDSAGYLHCLSKTDGHFIARTHTDDSGIRATPLFKDGHIIVQTNKGRVYAFEAKLKS